MTSFFLFTVFVIWNILHILFFKLNDILKISDSFSYLQMSYYFKNFSLEWFWNWWFWFLYSFFISIFDFFINNDILSSFVLNIFLFNILIYLCYLIWKKYLSKKYNLLFVSLLFFSPILLNYNINILSENIYIPLFICLFLWILNIKNTKTFSNSIFLWFILSLLYYTRSEAFIYILSTLIIFFWLYLVKEFTFFRFLSQSLLTILSFIIFVSPYIYYLHSFTWEWWLTNKWSSNLRQAELRWISKMDDLWFEKAVWELTPDSKHLIAWFAWWLKYDKPIEWDSFKSYIFKNPNKVINRVIENQQKLYINNLPNLILWNAQSLYKTEWSEFFYKNNLFLFIIIIPLLFLFYWIYRLIKNNHKFFVLSFFSFYLIASLFFTLFFVLDRYFIIFVPLFIFFIVYWFEQLFIDREDKILLFFKYFWLWWLSIWIYLLWIYSYYNSFKFEDDKYEVKKIAWEWIKNNDTRKNLKIMERFPIVTYYSWTKERWLTPFTYSINNLIIYALYNNIDYLVVDSIDFKTYRPWLISLLNDSNNKYDWLLKVKEFNLKWQNVILYKILKK